MGRWLLIATLVVPLLIVSESAAPSFSNLPAQSIDLREDIMVQTSFFEVMASDPDSDPLQYSIVGPPGTPFVIDPVTGIVSVKKGPGLDFETAPQRKIQISVNDTTQSVTSTLTVRIEDVNEPPAFTNLPKSVSIPEDATAATHLLNVTATDPEGQHVTYALTSPIGAPFKISPEGVLIMKKDPMLNYERFQEYTLTIAAIDGELSTLSTFVVRITDVNEPPKILNLGGKITIPRDTSGNIFYPHGVDEDFKDKLTYSFVSFPNTTDYLANLFTMDPLTGSLSVNCPPCLDPNIENMYDMYITVTDSAGHNTTATLYVEVVETMGRPEIWNLPAKFQLFENRTKGELIFTPRTIDLTAGGRLSYQMKVRTGLAQFTIDRDTGKVYVLDNPGFDFEKIPSYELQISVSNGVTSSARQNLYVEILNSNEKPVITNVQSAFSVPEDTNTSLLIDTVTATDPDDMTTLTYHLKVQPPSGQDTFAIDTHSGEVRVVPTGNLDYETQSEYTLFVTASDGVLRSDPFVMAVEVTDINEPPFRVTSYVTLNITEEMPVGSPLALACDASDPDTADTTLRYQMARSRYSRHFSLDSLHGCTLRIAKIIDSEDPTSPETFHLEIRAIDSGGLWTRMFIEVHVYNVNDNSPVFVPDEYHVSLLEGAVIGSPVVDVIARDLDIGEYGKLTYTIITSPGDHYFRVSPAGHVSLRGKLDRDTLDKIRFKVAASDGGSPSRSDTATVTVSILDSNDHIPAFTQGYYDFAARYDCVAGTSVGRISAIDNDHDTEELEYRLLGVTSEFTLNPTSGDLRCAESLAPDVTYHLQAEAHDHGEPPQTSKAVGIRVDTFICQKSLVRMDVNQATLFFDGAGRSGFLSALEGVFPGFIPGIEGVRPGEHSGTSIVTVYFARSNRTESFRAAAERKEFVSVSEIVRSSTTNAEGTPRRPFTTGPFVRFPITKIGPECVPEEVNWWLDTSAGRAVLAILCLIGATLLLTALACLASRFCRGFSALRFKGAGGGKIYPGPRDTLWRSQYTRYDDKQNWWKLKPKSTSKNASALEEKFRPPSASMVSVSSVRLKPPVSGRPLPGGDTGLEF